MAMLVAVCTNRSPEEVGETLEALAPQLTGGATALVVTSGLGASEHAAHAEAAGSLGIGAVDAPAGLSAARNAALHEAGGARVIAFVDDDAIPAPDWLERLSSHWAASGDEVGCVGGRILPRWSAPPPPWMTPALYPALSLLDLGEGMRELEPGTTDAYGANISFAVEALRRAGGFDPAYGAWRGVPLFGEESMVQRRLAELGYRVLYAGDAVVEHAVSPERLTLRGVARRRFWFGAVSASGGAPSPAGGAARVVKAGAGAGAAMAAGRRGIAAERAVRMAQNAGSALGPLLRRRLKRQGWPGGR